MLALIGCLGIACHAPTEPLSTTFRVVSPPPPTAATGASGRIIAAGAITTRCAPYEVRVATARDGQRLTLRLIGQVSRARCPQDVMGELGFEAEIGRLEPGTYQLHVVHTYTGASGPGETVLEEEVVVR